MPSNNNNKHSFYYRKIQGIMSGDSLMVIIPKEYARNLGIRKGDYMRLWMKGNHIEAEKADNV